MNHGFQAPVITPEDYVFGAQLGAKTLIEDGQWGDYLPPYEAQERNGLETMNCTSYGTLNCIETLMNFHYQNKTNYSERFTGVLAETTPSGNNPHKVAEVIRKEGLIAEALLPFNQWVKTWDDYYAPKPMAYEYYKIGRQFLQNYEIKHDWVFVNAPASRKPELLMKALQSSPLGVSVVAWHEQGGLYYKPEGTIDNHWATLYGYKEGEYWLVFDHYQNEHKKLEWKYNFGFAKRFEVRKKEHKDNWVVQFIKHLWSLIV